MPVTRLYPANTDESGSDLTPVGASPAHVALSDADDGTYCSRQLSQFQTVRFARGSLITQLPHRSVQLAGVTTNVRAWCSVSGAQRVKAGVDFNVSSFLVDQVLTDVPTTYSVGPSDLGTFEAINASSWSVAIVWIFNDGASGFVSEVSYDVTWFPISGLRVMLFELLGPLTALGLHDLAGLSDYLWRQHRTRLLLDELQEALADLRSYRHPRSVLLGRRARADATRPRQACGSPSPYLTGR